jgi:hypothetical protein
MPTLTLEDLPPAPSDAQRLAWANVQRERRERIAKDALVKQTEKKLEKERKLAIKAKAREIATKMIDAQSSEEEEATEAPEEPKAESPKEVAPAPKALSLDEVVEQVIARLPKPKPPKRYKKYESSSSASSSDSEEEEERRRHKHHKSKRRSSKHRSPGRTPSRAAPPAPAPVMITVPACSFV